MFTAFDNLSLLLVDSILLSLPRFRNTKVSIGIGGGGGTRRRKTSWLLSKPKRECKYGEYFGERHEARGREGERERGSEKFPPPPPPPRNIPSGWANRRQARYRLLCVFSCPLHFYPPRFPRRMSANRADIQNGQPLTSLLHFSFSRTIFITRHEIGGNHPRERERGGGEEEHAKISGLK